MLNFWKKFRYVALGGIALQFWGCGDGIWRNFWLNGVQYAALEFLLDNDGVFDLFADTN